MTKARQIGSRIDESLQDCLDCGGTNITEGLSEAGRQLLGNKALDLTAKAARRVVKWVFNRQVHHAPQSQPNERRKRIVLLCDGCHNTGPLPFNEAKRLRNAGVTIDVIGIGGSPNGKEFDEPSLKMIASKNADGTPRYRFISDAAELEREFEALAHHLRPM